LLYEQVFGEEVFGEAGPGALGQGEEMPADVLLWRASARIVASRMVRIAWSSAWPICCRS
jgi:hypothetical protein